MEAETTKPTIQTKIIRVLIATGLILLVPLVAMLFTDEVDWGLFDFVLIGTLLFGSGLVYVLVTDKIKSIEVRTAIALVIAAAVLLAWAELAVGVFGSPFAGS